MPVKSLGICMSLVCPGSSEIFWIEPVGLSQFLGSADYGYIPTITAHLSRLSHIGHSRLGVFQLAWLVLNYRSFLWYLMSTHFWKCILIRSVLCLKSVFCGILHAIDASIVSDNIFNREEHDVYKNCRYRILNRF